MIFIRADANKEIASGHVQRCLSIADILKEKGEPCLFICADDVPVDIIEKRGHKVRVLNTDFKDMESELPLLKKLSYTYSVMGMAPHVFLVDSYQVDEAYMKGLKEYGKVAYMDDYGLPVHPVDMLINYDIHSIDIPYEDYYEKKGYPLPKRLLKGCSYAPLRKEFSENAVHGKPKDRLNILVTTGGGDMARVMERLVKLIREAGIKGDVPLKYHLVAGPFMEEDEKAFLKGIAKEDERFFVHENVKDMWELMRDSHMAISSSGSTVYELCAMKVPAIIFTFADNQRKMAEAFGNMTKIPYAGDVSHGDKMYDVILGQLKSFIESREKRMEVSESMALVTDGMGAERIADELIKMGGIDAGKNT